jgi:hypothetical protein
MLYPKLGDKTIEPDVVKAIVRVFVSFKTEAQQSQVFDALKAEKTEAGKVALLQVVTAGKWKDTNGVLPRAARRQVLGVRRHTLHALLAGGRPGRGEKVARDGDDSNEGRALRGARRADRPSSRRWSCPRRSPRSTSSRRQVRRARSRPLTVVRHKSAVEPLIQRMSKEEGLLILDLARRSRTSTGKEVRAQARRVEQVGGPSRRRTPTTSRPPEGIAYLRDKRAAKSASRRLGDPKVEGRRRVHEHQDAQPADDLRDRLLGLDGGAGHREGQVRGRPLPRSLAHGDRQDRADAHDRPARALRALQHHLLRHRREALEGTSSSRPRSRSSPRPRTGSGASTRSAAPSKEDLASVGLTSSAGLDKGKTNTYGALKFALGVNDVRTADATYTKIEADTVFFLSDGRPTVGEYVDPDDILREIKALNDLRRVVLHTIAIGEFQKDFMERLAAQNGPGVFVDLGSRRARSRSARG